MIERNVFQFVLEQLDDSFDTFEKNAITRSVLFDIANFKPPWLPLSAVSNELLSQIDNAIIRINLGEPTQYVCGYAPFRNFMFYVNEHVLIPRPETEELIDLVLKNKGNLPKGKGLDIGTGSGAIAISIAKEADLKIDALDISSEALMVASKNIVKYNAEVNLIQNNILEINHLEKYAFFVSNPPYIPINEKLELNQSVYNYEPNLALFVPFENPLLFYQKIANLALSFLLPKGAIFFECHFKYAKEVANLMEYLNFNHVVITKDLQGKDRFVSGFLS